jgi:glycosyltransferase involved in cell wall biosynthesis
LVGLNTKQLKNIPKNIIGISKTEDTDQLASFYSMADLFVNPTYEDNFPSTNLEALACGTPVLTYRTGGSIEAVTIETGFVIEQGDVKAMLNIILKLKNKSIKINRDDCRNLAVKQYNKENSFLKYFRLYEQITAGI